MYGESYGIEPGVCRGYMAPAFGEADPAVENGIVCPCQTHTTNVGVLEHVSQEFPDTDALVTRLKGVRIGVRTADCVPVVMYAPGAEIAAAVHAGWKGTLAGIVVNALETMTRFGADKRTVKVFFGPSICRRCFEVGPELAELFRSGGFGRHVYDEIFTDSLSHKEMDPERPHIDLEGCNIHLLKEAGIDVRNISGSGFCTRHTVIPQTDPGRPALPSWRRDCGTALRMVTWIGMGLDT